MVPCIQLNQKRTYQCLSFGGRCLNSTCTRVYYHKPPWAATSEDAVIHSHTLTKVLYTVMIISNASTPSFCSCYCNTINELRCSSSLESYVQLSRYNCRAHAGNPFTFQKQTCRNIQKGKSSTSAKIHSMWLQENRSYNDTKLLLPPQLTSNLCFSLRPLDCLARHGCWMCSARLS